MRKYSGLLQETIDWAREVQCDPAYGKLLRIYMAFPIWNMQQMQKMVDRKKRQRTR